MIVGLNIDPNNPAGKPSIAELQSLGVDWVRMSYIDRAHGPATKIESYRSYLAELKKARIKTLMITGYDAWPGMPGFGANDTAWQVYSAELAGRTVEVASALGDLVDAWQIWNEPDLLEPSASYDPRMRPITYAVMLDYVAREIARVSKSTIVAGGLAGGQPAYWTQVVEAFGRSPAPVDVVAIHPYGRRPLANWPDAEWGFGALMDLAREYRAVTKLPIWITEVGTDDMRVQGEFPRRTFEVCQASGVVPACFWFCWSDGMVSPFGLIDAVGRDKPARAAYVAFTESRNPPQPGLFNWERSLYFVFRWEGELSLDPRDKGNWTGGAVGLGELRGTKYGISAAAYPHLDIRALTREQAVEIYKRDYWARSGSDKLEWPLCLAHFDTAVNAGVGRATRFLAQANGDFDRYVDLRRKWYRSLPAFETFGQGWLNRLADLERYANQVGGPGKPYTNQRVINAFYTLARRLGVRVEDAWRLVELAGYSWLINDRQAPYSGPALPELISKELEVER